MAPPATSGITSREREVWSLVAAHLTNKEIAGRLSLSVRTVESHVSSLIQKLEVADRRALSRHPGVAAAGGRWAGSRWPSPASRFIGRAAECAALGDAIAAHRMVTLTGPGGVGKTRLALQVVEPLAATRGAGGCFVDLVHASDPAMVVGAMAAAARVAAPFGGSLEEALVASLADSDAVILLDNCEHLIDAVRDSVTRLLQACPSLTIVATSRVPLRAPFEWVFPVPGLSSAAADGDAVSLFVERATAAGAVAPLDLHQVAALCTALGGMALAIELAAARCPALGLDGLAAGLDQRLRLLTSGAGRDHRHGSLREAIAWSFRLLSEPDRDLLASASVFAAWFDVDAALAVAGPGTPRFDVADGLARLADHSLLLVDPGRPTRYRALETIRQFGVEQLSLLGGSEAVHERHRRWCGLALAALSEQARDEAWCQRLDELAADVRAAVVHVEARRREPAAHQAAHQAAHLAERLAEQVLLRGRPHETQLGYEQAAALVDDPAERARLLRLAAGAAACRLVGNDALRLLRGAADLSLESGDRSAAAVDLAWRVVFLRWAPGILATIPERGTDESWLAEADSLAGDAAAPGAVIAVANAFGLPDDDARIGASIERGITLARDARTPLVESVALDRLCGWHLARGELLRASETTAMREGLLHRLGLDAATAYHFNDYLLMASEVHLAAGRLQPAAERADQLAALACYRDYPHPALARRIKVDAMAGHFEEAVERGERFLAAWERAGRPISGTLAVTAYALAMVHGLLGDEAGRSRWIDLTRTLTSNAVSLDACAWAQTMDALLALDRAQPQRAFECLSSDLDDRSAWNSTVLMMWRPWYAALWAESSVLIGHPNAAQRLARAAVAAQENEVAAAIVGRAAELLAGRGAALRGQAGTFAQLGCDYQRRRTEALADAAPGPLPVRPPRSRRPIEGPP